MESSIKISRGQVANVFKEYDDIDALIDDQSNQSYNRLYKVIDASLDPNITFPVGETKLWAYYEYKEVATSDIDDYTLISAPYAGGGGINFTTDESLYLDPVTNELRANVSDFSEKYTYTSGVQEFVLTSTPTKIIYISVNGQLLEDSLTQWSLDVPSKTITILDEMDAGDRVTIHYQYFITI